MNKWAKFRSSNLHISRFTIYFSPFWSRHLNIMQTKTLCAPALSRNIERFFKKTEIIISWKPETAVSPKIRIRLQNDFSSLLWLMLVNVNIHRSIWSADFLTYRWLEWLFRLILKFGYSEKATKFEKNLPHKIWRYWVASNFKWKIFSNFVAFSEYPNFTYLLLRVHST